MNEYLKPIFEKILPEIDLENLKYWGYGGVANAAMVGKFYRSNPDFDIFILDEEFKRFESILQDICKKNDWKICKDFTNNRIKIEVFIKKDNKRWIERMSIIVAHKQDDRVELKFKNGSEEYSSEILTRVERDLEGFKFFTISDNFLKKLFVEYLDSKKKYPSKRIEDARYILSEKEFKKYFPNEEYEKT